MKQRTLGLVLKTEDAGEADKIFSLFTQDFGMIEVRGKSIRNMPSKLRAGIALFSLSDIEFVQGKQQKILTDSALVKKYQPAPIALLEFLKTGTIISQIALQFINKSEADKRILPLLQDTFAWMSEPGTDFSLAQLSFFWRLTSCIGYTPQLFYCPFCQKRLHPYGMRFLAQEGGVFCRSCAIGRGQEINSRTVKLLRLLLAEDRSILLKLSVSDALKNQVNDISRQFFRHLLDIHTHTYVATHAFSF